MKLPNGDKAEVDLRKLTEYCLNPSHFRGHNKARVFASAMGIGLREAQQLRQLLLQAAREGDAVPRKTNAYGSRFLIEFPVQGIRGEVRLRSVWIIPKPGDPPRPVTCYLVV